MKTFTFISILLLASSAAFAQDKPKPVEPPKPPVLSSEEKLEFFKAQAELQSAQSQATDAAKAVQQKQSVLQESIKTITDACGKNFAPTIDPKGYPICVAKPEPEAKK